MYYINKFELNVLREQTFRKVHSGSLLLIPAVVTGTLRPHEEAKSSQIG